ncbi:MAG: histidine kinase [Chitinophagaceae bacterium]
MNLKLPQYNGKDNLVMLLVMPVFAFIINCIILEQQYFSSWKIFITATLLSGGAACIDFILCGWVAVALKERFPKEEDTLKRLSLMTITFLMISGLFLYSLFSGYEHIPMLHYSFNEGGFVWSYFALGILNIFLVFLMEGIARYTDWKKNRLETEALHRTYKQSQLHGLKSQVNPHFLFNSLNSLSSLIQDDEEKAERFLDEMSKVYRYMLRNDEDHLVTVETEMKFISSYLHLLKARYGDGLQVHLAIEDADKQKLLAPLALQVIIENSFSQNIVSKSAPLVITISSANDNYLEVRNNIQPKSITDAMDFEAGLDNLVKKYDLLNQPFAVSDIDNACRLIRIKLINSKEELAL